MSTPHTTPVETPEPDNSAPLFPPFYLLIIAAAGFLLALVNLLTQPSFGVAGWGGLGVGVLTLFAWALMAPDQARSLLTGRAAQFGGTAILVTVVFLAALVLIYITVRSLNIRQDVSNFEVFSLTDQARDIVRTLASDPTTPPMKIIGFYNAARAASQDRISVLLSDFQQTSNGRITYEFINPDQQPLLAEQYKARDGQFIVVPLDPATNEPVVDKAEIVTNPDQQPFLDALVKASAGGNFYVYYLDLADGIDFDSTDNLGGSILKEDLVENYSWTFEAVNLIDADSPLVKQPEPKPDGEVLLIAGGGTPLTDENLKVITDFMNRGGDVVILAGLNSEPGQPALANTPALNDYLFTTFGIRFNNDVVIDQNNMTMQSPLAFVASGFSAENYITREYDNDQDFLIYNLARSIEIAPQQIANVTVTVISRTSDTAYAKDNLQIGDELTNDDIQQQPTDRTGALVVAAAAENTTTGARLVLLGSDALVFNAFKQLEPQNVQNNDIVRRALFWANGYEQYRDIPSTTLVRPQAVPLIATDTELRTINLIAIFGLPFGILGVGVFVWWSRRERVRA